MPHALGDFMLKGMAGPLAKLVTLLKPKRRWAQFSLRGFLAAMTVFCAALALWIIPAEKQRWAVAKIESHGGRVGYAGDATPNMADLRRPMGMPNATPRPTATGLRPTAFLRGWLPRDYVAEVREVAFRTSWANAALPRMKALPGLQRLDLPGTRITDAGLVSLEELATLEELNLSMNVDITDAGLEHLHRLANLRELYLDFTQVTDAGLAHLEGLTKLQTLTLCKTQVTDAGLTHLLRLTDLRTLSLERTQLTDAGLAELAPLALVEVLQLDGTGITDAGLVHLQRLPRLQSLFLSATVVTDAGLVHLRELADLKMLFLNGTRVTDAGLADIERLTRLEELWLVGTQVTAAGKEQLRRALPKCNVH